MFENKSSKVQGQSGVYQIQLVTMIKILVLVIFNSKLFQSTHELWLEKPLINIFFY